jgi:hypothetical protein
MILSMHQPNFIPWIGFFDKIAQSDVFVILDAVQYPRGKSVANRNKILGKNGIIELVVPISVPKGNEGIALYTEVNFADPKWAKKLLTSIEHAYKKSPYFDKYFNYLTNLWNNSPGVCAMNIEFIQFVCNELQIETKLLLQSQIDLQDDRKNDLIVALCKSQHCDTYLSGKGASVYNDEAFLNQNGISLIYQNFKGVNYPQTGAEYVPNLSVLDLLFNWGSGSYKSLIAD